MISEVLSNSFNVIVKSLVYSGITMLVLCFISIKLVGVFFAGLFVLSLASGMLRRKTSQLNKEYQDQKAKLTQISEEIFGNIRTVKAFHNEKAEIEKFREINRRVVLIGKRRAMWSGIFQFVSYGILYGTLVGITYYGSILVRNGQEQGLIPLTSGMLMTFLFLLMMAIAHIV